MLKFETNLQKVEKVTPKTPFEDSSEHSDSNHVPGSPPEIKLLIEEYLISLVNVSVTKDEQSKCLEQKAILKKGIESILSTIYLEMEHKLEMEDTLIENQILNPGEGYELEHELNYEDLEEEIKKIEEEISILEVVY